MRGSITDAIGSGQGMGCSLGISANGSKYAHCYSIGFTDPNPNYDLQEIECRSLDLDEWDSVTASD